MSDGRNPIWNDLKDHLQNYKDMHKEVAEKKGVLAPLMAAPNLTRARQVVY